MIDQAEPELVERLRPQIGVRLKKLYAATCNDPERFDERVSIGSDARLGLSHLALPAPHDPDYAVFRHIRADQGVVIDAGANSGQSAASIWAAGSNATVLSFEPLPGHRPALEAIRRARPRRFLYRLVALSDRDGDLELMMPVVNGRSASWLATVPVNVDWPKLALTVARFVVARQHYRDGQEIELDIVFMRVAARRLDTMLANALKGAVAAGVSAIKIDVEGHETELVAGAGDTIARHRPMLLIERAQNRPEMLKRLLASGYRFGARESDRLVPTDAPGRDRNTYLWHPSHQDEYRRRGLLSTG